MARYQIYFRSNNVDDSTADGDRASYMRQPLGVGTTITSQGTSWLVVEASVHDGAHRFMCDEITYVPPVAPLVRAPAAPPLAAS